ncbi:MAG TPA: hypothetical protein VF472_21485 [Burkholderiaceae bacterium]
MNLTKSTVGLLAILMLARAGSVWAEDLTPDGLAAKYPSGSIQTQETAEQALREVDQQRGAVEQKFADQQHGCYSKFFATKCLDAAKEERRVALAQIRKVEVDANAYIRAARVVERDRNLAEKRARDAANPPKPLGEAASKQSGQTSSHDPNEGERRITAHEAKLKAAQQNEAANAADRAAKVEAYNKKVADAEQRQREVAQKKAEKQKEAEQKAAKAAKAQQDAASKAQVPASASGSGSASAPGATPAPKP